jgi:hypothetical protein
MLLMYLWRCYFPVWVTRNRTIPCKLLQCWLVSYIVTWYWCSCYSCCQHSFIYIELAQDVTICVKGKDVLLLSAGPHNLKSTSTSQRVQHQ